MATHRRWESCTPRAWFLRCCLCIGPSVGRREWAESCGFPGRRCALGLAGNAAHCQCCCPPQPCLLPRWGWDLPGKSWVSSVSPLSAVDAGGVGGAAPISTAPFLCAAAVSVFALLCPIASLFIPGMTHGLVLKEHCISAEMVGQVNSFTYAAQQKCVICWLLGTAAPWARQKGLPHRLQPIEHVLPLAALCA